MLQSFVNTLPVKRLGMGLAQHPEIYHLRILNACALNCGAGALLVEDGPTNGAVTYALLQSLVQFHDQRLVVLGPVGTSCQAVIDNSGVADRVSYALDTTEPMLWFVGDTDPDESIKRALAAPALAIFLYDINTAGTHGLTQFAAHAQAARELRADTSRGFHWLDATIGTQQTRRGMLVSTALGTSEATIRIEEPVVVAEKPLRGARFKRIGS